MKLQFILTASQTTLTKLIACVIITSGSVVLVDFASGLVGLTLTGMSLSVLQFGLFYIFLQLEKVVMLERNRLAHFTAFVFLFASRHFIQFSLSPSLLDN